MILLRIIARTKLFWHNSSTYHCRTKLFWQDSFYSSLPEPNCSGRILLLIIPEPNCSGRILLLIIARTKLFWHDSSTYHCPNQAVLAGFFLLIIARSKLFWQNSLKFSN
jgi:hypothetical protein